MCKARRQFWAGQVDAAVTDTEAFRLAFWSKPRLPEIRGPLHFEDETAETDLQKLNLFLRAHVLRESEVTVPDELLAQVPLCPVHPTRALPV